MFTAHEHNLCMGPPTPHVTTSLPRIVYTTFYGATMTIKGSLYLSTTDVKVIFGRKKVSPVKKPD